MPWELIVENIGGLKGKFNFTLKKGLNILNAPNISGKTSILNALKLLAEGDWTDENLNAYLNDASSYGNVELINHFKQKVSLTRSKDEVTFLSRDLEYKDPRTKSLCYLMNDSDLIVAINKGDEKGIEKWFKNITNLEYYEIAKSRTESVFRGYNEKKNKLENEIKGSIQELKSLNIKWQQELDNLVNSRKQILTSPELKSISEKINKIEEEIDNKKNRLKDIDNELSKVNLKLKTSENNLEKTENDIREEDDNIEALKKENLKGQERILELEEIYKQNKINLKNIEKETDGYDEVIEGKTTHIEGLTEILRNLKKELDKKKSLKGLKHCPRCDSKLNPTQIKNRIDKLNIEINEKNSLLRKRNIEKKEINKAQKDIKSEIEEIQELPDQINKAKQNLLKLKSSRGSIRGAITTNSKEKERLETEKESIEGSISEMNQKLKDLMGPHKELTDKLADIEVKANDLTIRISDANAKIKHYEEGTEEIKLIRKKVDLAEEIVKYFASCLDKIEKTMLDKLNKSLDESFQLLELAELDRILVTKKFDIIITRKGGYESSISELSGAERTLIAFIIMAVAKNTFLTEFPFLIVDELGEYMDQTRFLKAIEYLEQIVEVLVITRNKPLEGKPTLISQQDIIHSISDLT